MGSAFMLATAKKGQCRMARGNVLAEEEQWAKLRMIVELAEEVWGK